MYLPRLPTAVMSELRSWRLKPGTRNAWSDSFEIEFGGEDAPSDDERRQGADDVFYFGKFRH